MPFPALDISSNIWSLESCVKSCTRKSEQHMYIYVFQCMNYKIKTTFSPITHGPRLQLLISSSIESPTHGSPPFSAARRMLLYRVAKSWPSPQVSEQAPSSKADHSFHTQSMAIKYNVVVLYCMFIDCTLTAQNHLSTSIWYIKNSNIVEVKNNVQKLDLQLKTKRNGGLVT